MEVIRARNVNEAFYRGVLLMTRHAWKSEPHTVRGMEVFAYPEPVTTVYLRPQERVLFLKHRNANHFFHYLESLWILAGQNSVWPLKFFVKNIQEYSDDGSTFHGSYGERLRAYGSGMDQIEAVLELLAENPRTRRAVLQIWNPHTDLNVASRDIPCNDTIFLSVDPEVKHLNITVANRSNDMIWGCYGANAVQFSVVQEYLASRLGLGVGTYHQVSNNFHVYTNNPTWVPYYNYTKRVCYEEDHYEDATVDIQARPMFGSRAEVGIFDAEVGKLFEGETFNVEQEFRHEALINASRMIRAYRAIKKKDYAAAAMYVTDITFPDWKFACRQWIEMRRESNDKAG